MVVQAEKYHSLLAEYFASKDYFLESLDEQTARAKRLLTSPRPVNTRKVVELPWQRQQANQWAELTDILGNLTYLELIWQQNQEDVLRYWHNVEDHSRYSMVKVYTPEHCDPIKHEGLAWIPARLLLDTGKLNEATALWKLIVGHCRQHNDPELNGALTNLGIALEVLHDFEGAMRCYAEQARLSEAKNDLFALQAALGNMGNVSSELGDLDAALELHKGQEEICRAFYHYTDLHRALGNQGTIYAKRGDLETALRLFIEQEEICKQVGDHRSMNIAIINQANVAFLQNDLSKTELLAKKAIVELRELNAKEYLWQGLTMLGHVYAIRGLPEKFKPLYEDAESICKELGTTYYLSQMFYQLGVAMLNSYKEFHKKRTKTFIGVDKFEEYVNVQERTVDYLDVAVTAFQKALAIQPGWAEASLLLGSSFESKKCDVDAIEAYETALRLRPEWPQLYRQLGLLLVKQESGGMIDRGIQLLHKAALNWSDDQQIYVSLIEGWIRINKSNEAASEFINFVKRFPDATQLHQDILITVGRVHGLANVLFQSFQKSTRNSTEPDAFLFNYSLGLLYAALGMHSEAIPVYEESIRCNSEFGPAYHNLGLSYYYCSTLFDGIEQKLRTEKAINNCRTATIKSSNLAEPHYFLGVIRMDAGDYGLALTHFLAFSRIASRYQYLAAYIPQANESIQFLKEKLRATK